MEPEPTIIPSIPPHTYPLWIRACGLITLGFFAYSIYLLPVWIKLAQSVESAKKEYRSNNITQARKLYTNAYEKHPSARSALIGMLECIFSEPQSKDDFTRALEIANTARMSDGDADRLFATLENYEAPKK